MNNVEFVKAYEHWKLFDAGDKSPEKFQRQLELEQQDKRVVYLREMAANPDWGVDAHLVEEVLTGVYDGYIKAAYEEAEND